MANKKDAVSIDLSCKQTLENDIETKEGQRTTYTGTYKGSMLLGEDLVSAELKLKSDDKDALEKVVPLMVGAKRRMELSLTNEDLDNHPETKQK